MTDNNEAGSFTSGATALEHLTGPSRGRMTWLNGPDLDIFLGPNRVLRIDHAKTGEVPENLMARLHQTDGSYEIEASFGPSVWLNGNRITAATLKDCDMIEFGAVGPLSRFRLYHGDARTRKLAGDILTDGLVYLRVSRKPVLNRFGFAFAGVIRRLAQETTVLFRGSVAVAIIGLALLAWHQSRLNIELETRIESSANRLEGIAGVLTRAREEALTPRDLTALRQELAYRLTVNAERLAELERLSTASARVIAESAPSIVFLQGAYGFRETKTDRILRLIVDDKGRPLISPAGQPMLSLEGVGPVAERQFTGTGFGVGTMGAIITNRHVARPWEKDANVRAMAAQGLEPVMLKYIVFAAGGSDPAAVEVVRVSDDSDLAVLRHLDLNRKIPGLALADGPPAAGDEVIVMGYPTGLRSMLAQSGEGFIDELQKDNDTDFWSVAMRLAARKLIAPLSSRGIVSQVSPSAIVYDAETTHGGSGGPVLDVNGAVVAVNMAILPEYGGSNLGVPVDRVRTLLQAANMF